MDELRRAAVAYYKNGSHDQREAARKFFKAMDTNSDGKVTWMEFSTYLRQKRYFIDRNLYNKVDQNHDGFLDFKAFLTMFYIIRTRSLVCNHCKEHLLGLYFSCVDCFNRADNTYNLCITCYKNKSFSHRHRHGNADFLDNHTLLMTKRSEALAKKREAPAKVASDNRNQAIVPARQLPAKTETDKAFRQFVVALEIGKFAFGVASAVNNMCTIM